MREVRHPMREEWWLQPLPLPLRIETPAGTKEGTLVAGDFDGAKLQVQIGDDVVAPSASLPRAELVFSRQMMQHLCVEDALRFLRLVSRSGARFALLTTFQTDKDFVNADIDCKSGGYRPQDLTKAPFSLPLPLMTFSENYPTDPRVGLGLWSIRALRHRML